MSAWLPIMMQVAGTALSAMSQKESSNATASSYTELGDRQYAASQFEADQLDMSAGQQVAAAQRAAEEERRNAAIISSRALAVAAASGGGATDPTIVKMLARISGEGQYRSMVQLYQGEEQARQLRMKAYATRYSGETARMDAQRAASASKKSGDQGVMNTLLSGASSLFSKYGMGGPGENSSSSGGGSDPGWGLSSYDGGGFSSASSFSAGPPASP